MTRKGRTRNRRGYIAAAVLLSSALSVAGCSFSESTEFVVPDDICGVSTRDVGLEAAFPAGTPFEEAHEVRENSEYCHYRVDGTLTFSLGARVAMYPDLTTPPDEWADPAGPYADPVAVPGEHAVAVWPGLAMAEGECEFRGEPYPLEVQIITEYPQDPAESIEFLSGIVHPVVDALEQRCTARSREQGAS
ncbi:hypothetical protein [Streptomyces lonarensis]|uniref:DUF3558 domain-containing protein n=1 Tax=Streptomyces lonarensis TaxID=700599 RepID=A0A7X6HXD3_9ACTN|nr:hypothetical protein [Streptomyces lonarensis]NJQ04426.1 hypothetical protein [Streptomyces lonarensis]